MTEILDKQTIKALSADARQDIMKLLARRPHTASELSKITKKHVTTVTEHLGVLERGGLVRKKESTNKWVYYTLTDKGEHLFKPQFYSWVVVLSVSAVLMFTGFLRIFSYPFAKAERALDAAEAMQAVGAPAQIQPLQIIDTLGVLLIVLSLAGFAYVGYRLVIGRSRYNVRSN